ncbi:MAG: hypothetical protein ACUZ8E_00270 [Candidatus Anammoxibacter sp.]
MPISFRLDRELENKLKQTAKNLNVNKTDIVRISLTKYLAEIDENKQNIPYAIYCKLEDSIPGSGHGYLSVNHRSEVLERIKKGS